MLAFWKVCSFTVYTQFLVGAPFALITASIRRVMDQFVALLRWYGSPDFFDSGLQLICIFGLLFLTFLLTIPPRFSMGFRSSEFAGQSSTPTPWSFNPTFGAFGSVGRWQILLENEISIFKKLVSRRKHEVLQHFLVNGCSDIGFKKHNGPTPADDIAPQILTDCGNLTLDFKQLGLWASPPFLQTLGPWFPNEIQNLLSSEKRTLDHWATVQFFLLLSPGKTPLMTTVAKFLDTSVCGGSWCLDPSLSPFLVKFTQILESILLDNPHKFSRLVGHLFLPHFFLPLNFLLTCLDTALCEQPASLAMNVCGLPSLWSSLPQDCVA